MISLKIFLMLMLMLMLTYSYAFKTFWVYFKINCILNVGKEGCR